MAKGNHIFNHFKKTISNAFEEFVAQPPFTPKGHPPRGIEANRQELKLAIPRALLRYDEIVNAQGFVNWDELQDDQKVDKDDDNSQKYGTASQNFIRAIAQLADHKTRPGANPGYYWKQMMETGYDEAAAQRWFAAVKNAERQKREQRVRDTTIWIKGPLNNLVGTWIQYLRLDLSGKK